MSSATCCSAETRADAFARHLLAPVDGLRDFIGARSPVALSALSAVVQRFLVSPQVAAIALCQAGYVDEATKRDWMMLRTPQLAARFGWSDQYQALQADSDRRRAPQRLLARAIAAHSVRAYSAISRTEEPPLSAFCALGLEVPVRTGASVRRSSRR